MTTIETATAQSLALSAHAKSLAVTSRADMEAAASLQGDIKALLKQVEAFCDPNIARWHAGHKQALAEKNAITKPLDEGYKILGRAMGDYEAQLERERIAKERELQAERQRIADEETLKLAAQLEQQGHAEAAQNVIETVPEVIVKLEREEPKIAGTITRTDWRFEVVNPALIPREFLRIDESAIGAMVRSRKGETTIPGVRVWSETSVGSRR